MFVLRERSAVLLVFLLAVALRLYGLGDWSLWEDEETTIYFSYHPTDGFPRMFPTFFLLLGYVYNYTGCSVLVGRLLAAAFGILSLVLTYAITRRFAGGRVALVALVAVAVSPGHLFWSQSIRYYGLVICLQLLSIWLFLEGIRRQQAVVTAISALPVGLAMTCHRSAALLMPVLLAYLGWKALRRDRTVAFRVVAMGIVAILAVNAYWAREGASMLTLDDMWRLESARSPTHLLVTAAFYFGPPAVLLAAYGAWRRRGDGSDEVCFFALLALVPVTALTTLAVVDLINVTYYYGLIALVGVAVLAGHGGEGLVTWRPWARRSAIGLAALYYVVVLGAYFGPAYGDRPRWREAADHIKRAHATAGRADAVYAQVPGVVAFYLDVPPSDTMGHPSVRHWSGAPASAEGVSWIIGEQRMLAVEQRVFVDTHCRLSARWPARMIFRDRTLVVYRCFP